MKNGDRVTGEIIKKDDKTVTVKTEFFGTVTLPYDSVTSITADKPLNIVLPGDKTVQGTLATTGDKVEVTSAGSKQTVAPSEIKVLRNSDEQKAYERMLHPGFADLWIVTGAVNIAGTAGNAKTATFTTPFKAARVSRTSKTTAYFNFIKASALVNNVSAETARAVRGGWGYSRNLKPKLFWDFFNDWEYDKFQSLDLRTVIGSGLGYSVWKGERGRLDLLGGIAWNREKFDPIRPAQPFVRNSAEAYWGDDLTYKMNSRVSMYQNYRMFNNLTNTGAYRQNFDLGLNAALTKWLTWNAAFSDRYLSNPVAGRKKNDVLYTTGFGFTFAR